MGQGGDGKLCSTRGVPHRAAPSCPQTSLQSQQQNHFAPLQTHLLPTQMYLGQKQNKKRPFGYRRQRCMGLGIKSHSSSFG